MTLQRFQTPTGGYAIIAIDQRASLAKLLGVDVNSEVGTETLREVKAEFMEHFSSIASAVLTDGEYGIYSLPKKAASAGLLLALEESAYTVEDKEALPTIKQGWSVEKIAEFGAGVKLVLQYHPDASSASEKKEFVQNIHAKTKALMIPFVLEPLLYKPSGMAQSQFEAGSIVAQQRMARELSAYCDLLKLEFPIPADETLDPDSARRACKELTESSQVPWILLSKGMPFERFAIALELALESGCKGFAVGRAVWKEIGECMNEIERKKFLQETAVPRLRELRAAVDQLV